MNASTISKTWVLGVGGLYIKCLVSSVYALNQSRYRNDQDIE